MRNVFAILIGRLVRRLVRMVRPGGGSALPGLLVSKLAPNLLANAWRRFSLGVVVVTGSAGKSSTTKMLVAIARAHGLSVFTNPSTANIRQGFFATILEQSDWRGAVPGDIAILEMDEGHAAEILSGASARFVTILNVTEDQLDRFVDPALVRQKLLTAGLAATEGVILNADDQNLLLLQTEAHGRLANTSFFGFEASITEGRFLGFAPTYLAELNQPASDSVVTGLRAREVEVAVGGQRAKFTLPNRGIHYAADAAAALETARRLFGERFELQLAAKTLTDLPPVFARGELTKIQGQAVELVLVQNPASFQLNLDALPDEIGPIMIAIGRDVHDPSWLWTVNYQRLSHIPVVSGFNAFEMALCLEYQGVQTELVTDELEPALEAFLALPNPASGVKTILLSADAMRRYRRMLGFISPDMVGAQ